MSSDETKKPTKATSPRKIEANRRNAQHSTGPKTDEGKARSSQNSITHGIFVTKFLNGATLETVAEIEEMAAGLRDYYKPQSIARTRPHSEGGRQMKPASFLNRCCSSRVCAELVLVSPLTGPRP